MGDKIIALEARLKGSKNILTLGVRTNFSDYTSYEADLIRNAPKIYYPSAFYADLFDAMGIKTFPSYHTYKFAQDKIKQTALFEMLRIPHPKTKVFYGKSREPNILAQFEFPFIAKISRGSAMGRGVFLIKTSEDLETYLDKTTPAYIQEYFPIDRDLRVVVIGNTAVIAYWRITPDGEYRSNVALGATISFEKIPEKAIAFAIEIAQKCQWDDVGIDICVYNGDYYVLEANMKYGREGFRAAGLDYIKLVESMIANGQI